jgi:hypothetical protein
MSTAMSTSDLAGEIQQLESELEKATQAAARAKLNSADHEAAFFKERLREKKAELQAQQAAEAQDKLKRQHAQQLVQLVETEKEINRVKVETLALRRLLSELPQKLSVAEYQLGQLLRTYARLKEELKG